MNAEDRELFERLCVASAPAMSETGFPVLLDRKDCAQIAGNALSILEALRMVEATPELWKTLSSIRAAEGEEATDDPPPVVIEMPEGWEAAHNANVIYGPGKVGHRPWLERQEGFLMVRKLPSYSRAVPLSAVALLLRSAGWRVEGPRD